MKKKKLLSNAEIASFCTQTALLFQAGITPSESMEILLTDTKQGGGREIISQILDICRQGETFHKALEQTGLFPDYVVHMIALGEESGNLDTCMLSLSSYYDKEENISDSIRGAVTYPLIMIGMMLVVIFVLISKVLPIFNEVFVQLGSEMTGFSATLLALGNSMNRYSLVFVILLCLLAACYFIAVKTPIGRREAGRFLNVFPLTRGFYEKVACERFASGMAMAMSSGMDTYTSLDMVSQLVGNRSMQDKIAACRKCIEDGGNFSEALANSHIFGNLHSRMVAVGLRSGNIDTVLLRIADSYEKETDRRIQSILSILEPTLVIILSLIVGLILLSVILPLMGIMASIG